MKQILAIQTHVKRTPFGTYTNVRLVEGVRLIEVLKIAHCLLTMLRCLLTFKGYSVL